MKDHPCTNRPFPVELVCLNTIIIIQGGIRNVSGSSNPWIDSDLRPNHRTRALTITLTTLQSLVIKFLENFLFGTSLAACTTTVIGH